MFITNSISVIILAGGKGSRMQSDIPKVTYKIGGKFILQHLVDSVSQMNIGTISIYVVYGCNKEIIKKTLSFNSVISNNKKKIYIYWVSQNIPNGTGHAVKQALPLINDNEKVLILYGDVPLVSYKTLEKLFFLKLQCDIALLTADISHPAGYGRVLRNKEGYVNNIIEHDDIINDEQMDIKEINSGIFFSMSGYLKNWLNELTNKNVKNEFYLTDIINIAYKRGYKISTTKPVDVFEIMGINNKLDLIYLERKFQKIQAKKLLLSGLMIVDPNRFDLRGTLKFGKDVFIDVNVIIKGYVLIGDRVKIGSGCILHNSIIESDVVIYPFSIIEGAKINTSSEIGPFARLRSGTKLETGTKVGNFVELKNVVLGEKSKVKHLSYIGDAEVGSKVNFGAGTIVCNYDGLQKHRTVIGNDVFIGADSQLVAPVTIENNAIIGAGTTITKNVLQGETVISRIRQFSITNKKKFKKIK